MFSKSYLSMNQFHFCILACTSKLNSKNIYEYLQLELKEKFHMVQINAQKIFPPLQLVNSIKQQVDFVDGNDFKNDVVKMSQI